MSLRKRLTLLSAAGIALVLIVGSAATYLIERQQLRGQVDASLARDSTLVFFGQQRVTRRATGKVAARVPSKQLPNLPQSAGKKVTTIIGPRPAFGSLPTYVELIDRHGKTDTPVVGGVKLPVSERALEIARSGSGAYYADIHLHGTHLRMRVAPAKGGHALLVARSLREVDRALNRLAWSLGITAAIGILLAALVGAAVARGALRPVRELTVTAERVTRTRDLGERIETAGDDELSRLGSSFNAMLDSLESALRSQRRLVADASHELRTPLTSLRTNIDVLRQGATLSDPDRQRLLADIGDELEELTILVANVVELARGSQRDLHLDQIRLDQIAQAVVQRARTRFPQFRFDLEAEPTTVWGDPQELERAIWNLVENAAKWSNGGAHVEIEAAHGEISVRDHGPGIAASDRALIFDRFYRSETARGQPGSGLGLAIVRQVAESHGGTVDVDDATGGGARFRLTLLESA
jgi:two-component system, OmpR family, sensor histidine kinase MprB